MANVITNYETNLLVDKIINELKPDGVKVYRKSRLEDLFCDLERDLGRRLPEENFSDAILLLKDQGYNLLIGQRDYQEYLQVLKMEEAL